MIIAYIPRSLSSSFNVKNQCLLTRIFSFTWKGNTYKYFLYSRDATAYTFLINAWLSFTLCVRNLSCICLEKLHTACLYTVSDSIFQAECRKYMHIDVENVMMFLEHHNYLKRVWVCQTYTWFLRKNKTFKHCCSMSTGLLQCFDHQRSFGILDVGIYHSYTKGHSITPDVAVPVCRFGWMSVVFQWARGHVANLKGLVFVCYLSARHRPSQVTATPQPICVITTTFSHFPDNVLPPPQPTPLNRSTPFMSLFPFFL